MTQEVRSELYFLIAKFIKQDFPEFGEKFIKGCEERGLFPSRIFVNKPSFQALDQQLLSGIPNDQLLRLITLSCPPSQYPSLIFNQQKQNTSLNRSDNISYNIIQPVNQMHKMMPAYRISGHFDSCFCIAIDYTSQILITGADDFVIKIWKIPEMVLIKSIMKQHNHEITEIVIHPQNHIFASASYDGKINIFSLQRLELTHRVQLDAQVQSIRFSPCGRYLVAGCDKGLVKLFDVNNEKIKLNFEFSIEKSTAWVAFSPGGNFFAVSAEDGVVVVVNIEHKQLICLVGHSEQPDFVWFSRNSPYLIFSMASKEKGLKGWQATENLWGKKINFSTRCPTNTKNRLARFAVNCDDTRVIGISSNWIFAWDTVTHKQVSCCNHQAFTDHCTTVAAHPRLPNIVFVGTESGRSSMWDIESGKMLAYFSVEEGGKINDAVWSHDGSVCYAIDECGGITAFLCGKRQGVMPTTEMFFKAENDETADPHDDTFITDSQGTPLMPQPRRWSTSDLQLKLKPPEIDQMIIDEEEYLSKLWKKKSTEAEIGEQMKTRRGTRSRDRQNEEEEDEDDETVDNSDDDNDNKPQNFGEPVSYRKKSTMFEMVSPTHLLTQSSNESDSQSYSTHDDNEEDTFEENDSQNDENVVQSSTMSTRSTRRADPEESMATRLRASRPVRSWSPPSSSKKGKTKSSPQKSKPSGKKKGKVIYHGESDFASTETEEEEYEDDFVGTEEADDEEETNVQHKEEEPKHPPTIGIMSRRQAKLEHDMMVAEARKNKNKRNKPKPKSKAFSSDSDDEPMSTRSRSKRVNKSPTRSHRSGERAKIDIPHPEPRNKIRRSVPTPPPKQIPRYTESEDNSGTRGPTLFQPKVPSIDETQEWWLSTSLKPGIFYPQKGQKVVFVSSALKAFSRDNSYPFTAPYRLNKHVSPLSKGEITSIEYRNDGCTVNVKFPEHQFECQIYVPVPSPPLYLIPQEIFEDKLTEPYKRGRKVKTIDNRPATVESRVKCNDGFQCLQVSVDDNVYTANTWDIVKNDSNPLNMGITTRLERANQRAGQRIDQHIGKIPRIENCQNDKRIASKGLRPISLEMILKRCQNAYYKSIHSLISDIDELVKVAAVIGVKGEAFKDLIDDVKEDAATAFRGIE